MTGCCATGCSNRTEKGFKMYRFPTDVTRRKHWQSNVGRRGWTPTNSSTLCQEHFDYDQFENMRIDGKKKLRNNAVPTIFTHLGGRTKLRKPLKKRALRYHIEKVFRKRVVQTDHTYSANLEAKKLPEPVAVERVSDVVEKEPYPWARKRAAPVDEETKRHIKELKEALCKSEKKCKELIEAQAKQESAFTRLFGKDQLKALTSEVLRVVEWSPATIEKARQLKSACGRRGYEYLLKQNYPLPSIRTIQRRMVPSENDSDTNHMKRQKLQNKSMKCTDDTTDDVIGQRLQNKDIECTNDTTDDAIGQRLQNNRKSTNETATDVIGQRLQNKDIECTKDTTDDAIGRRLQNNRKCTNEIATDEIGQRLQDKDIECTKDTTDNAIGQRLQNNRKCTNEIATDEIGQRLQDKDIECTKDTTDNAIGQRLQNNRKCTNETNAAILVDYTEENGSLVGVPVLSSCELESSLVEASSTESLLVSIENECSVLMFCDSESALQIS